MHDIVGASLSEYRRHAEYMYIVQGDLYLAHGYMVELCMCIHEDIPRM